MTDRVTRPEGQTGVVLDWPEGRGFGRPALIYWGHHDGSEIRTTEVVAEGWAISSDAAEADLAVVLPFRSRPNQDYGLR